MAATVPQELAFADAAPWQIDVTGELHAPVDRVWATFTDNPTWATWFSKCRSCISTSDPATGVGSTRTIVVNGLKVDERFIAWEPEKLWAFTVVALRPAFATSMVERATFTSLSPTTTRVDYRIAIAPTWWARPLRSVLGKQTAAAFATSFAKLDQLLAAQP